MKPGRNHLKGVGLAVILVSALGMQSAMASPGTIVGSKHDFSASGYSGTNNTNAQVCIYCHAPHNNLSAAGALLWNRAASTATYIAYSSPSMNGAPTATSMGPTSKVCLSCHDGAIAVDSYGTFTGATKASGAVKIGPDLSNDHPIGFTYDAALVTLDPGLKAITSNALIGNQTSGTIDTKMLFGGKVECASCHDVHNSLAGTAVQDKLLRITSAASAICRTCHIK